MGLFLFSLLSALPGVMESAGGAVSWVFLINETLPALRAGDAALIARFGGEVISMRLQTQADAVEFADAATTNRTQLDHALAQTLVAGTDVKNIFFIPALFSREIYPVFPTVGTTNLTLFHDLIPFLYADHYFGDPTATPSRDYAQRFQEVYKTDMFVTNSQTTADDLTVYLGVAPDRIVAISGAGADRSHLKPVAPSFAKDLQKDFVLMPSGDDFRKNNRRAVEAFAELGGNHQLVITSRFGPESQAQLKSIYPNIIFSGNVADAELLWLFDAARLVFFPTEYEGLGMPALEAVEHGVPIACANIPVFVEISPEAFFYFDPKSPADIAQVLKTVLSLPASDPLITAKKQQYPALLKRFSWPKTARLFLQAVAQSQPAGSKQRLAVFCPSPSSYSAVGKFAFEVHAELCRLYNIDYYAENGLTPFQPTRLNILQSAATYYPASEFPKRAASYDRVLYHLGNSEFHIQTIMNALTRPAYAIAHDTKLNGIFDYMVYHGFIPPERREYERVLDSAFGGTDTSCLTSLLTNQRGVFCHSAFANRAFTELISAASASVPVHETIHPIGVPAIQLQRSAEAVVSFAGIITEDKGIKLVSEVSGLPNVSIKVFGFGAVAQSSLDALEGPNITITRDLSDKDFQDMLRATDVLVNYRANYHGETSRSVLEAMRYGVAVIVKDVGWYSELPDDVVVKVTDEAGVLAAIRMLTSSPEQRSAIGTAARQFLMAHYGYERYARVIHDNIEEMDGN